MKPVYPIRGVLAYCSPQRAQNQGIVWRESPHVYFANLSLDWKSLLAFDKKYGVLLAEHWQMKPELRSILLKAPNLTQEERKKWAKATPQQKWTIAVSDADVQLASRMQSLLQQAWKGKKLPVQLIEFGEEHHSQQEAFGQPRITVSPSKQGLTVYAKDLWSFIRLAFLLDSHTGRTRVCDNPDCAAPYFLARRKDQRICSRGECSKWAQREWALAWWNQEGRKRRGKIKRGGCKLKRRASAFKQGQ